MQETQETQVQSLGGKDPLEKRMAMLSSILAWRTPWTEVNEPGKANLTTGPLSLTSQHGLGQTHIWAKTISPLRRAESSWQSLKSLSSYVKRK